VEGLHSHDSRPRLGKVVGLLPYRLARSWPRDPFCSTENMQGLADPCCCAGVPSETRRCGCEGHWRISLSLPAPWSICVSNGSRHPWITLSVLFSTKRRHASR